MTHEAKARDSLLGTENPVVSRRLLQLVTVAQAAARKMSQ